MGTYLPPTADMSIREEIKVLIFKIFKKVKFNHMSLVRIELTFLSL
jgi:hypothetical protein